MALAMQSTDSLTLNIHEEIYVHATLPKAFTTLLEHMGPLNQTPDGKPMPMKMETWPGGRWYRDLGGDAGHFWGHVQAIKPPGLLEIVGPLFSSLPLISNLQFRLTEEGDGTKIVFRHTAAGYIEEQHKEGVRKGWISLLERVRAQAEATSSQMAKA